MKRFITIALVVLCSVATNAQEVTKFLGIPVDGSEREMLKKIEEKGFTLKLDGGIEYLEGIFNGQSVRVRVSTNAGKVKRVIVFFEDTDPANLKISYNNLVYQFKKNPKYVSSEYDDFIIPDNEDILYEASIHNKRYDAVFFQRGENGSIDGIEYRVVWFIISKSILPNKGHIVLYYDNEYNGAHGEDL